MKEPDFDGSSLERPDTEPVVPDAQADEQVNEGAEEESAPGETGDPAPEEVFYVRKGSVRRRPKYATFGVLGGLVGLIAGLVLAQTGAIPADQDYTRLDLTIVLVGLGVPAGILLALLLALILDRRRK